MRTHKLFHEMTPAASETDIRAGLTQPEKYDRPVSYTHRNIGMREREIFVTIHVLHVWGSCIYK